MAYDPAIAPVSAIDLESVLAQDLSRALERGKLAPWTGAGVSIGVVKNGIRRVFSFGAAKPDSIFEIGSLTKPFTGLMLAQIVEQGRVKLDEPVRELLPPGVVAKPPGREITLLDLATQRSGLPRLPANLKPANKDNPYADYDAAKLYAALKKQGVAIKGNPPFLYSNFGFGLLGHALSVRAGIPFASLLQDLIAGPLGLNDTTIALSPTQQSRFLPGHDSHYGRACPWDLDAVAGAGAIRSTAGDMLAFLEANLHPERFEPPLGSTSASTLKSALVLSQQVRAFALPGMQIALGWLRKAISGGYWHNGATGGYSSYAFFDSKEDCAAVVLFDTSIGSKGSFADLLGQHISERLAGKPAIPLAD